MTFSNNESRVMTALETVIDPELGIDIVNLGLIYEVEVINHHCHIKMTLTTQGCPLSDLLHQAIQQAVLDLPTIDTVEIQLVWYPLWSVEKMSRYARVALGIGG